MRKGLRPEDWLVLRRKSSEMPGRDYDWSGEAAAMRTPTMPVYADADAIRPSHASEFFEAARGMAGLMAPECPRRGWRLCRG
jgi:hypothetical protein